MGWELYTANEPTNFNYKRRQLLSLIFPKIDFNELSREIDQKPSITKQWKVYIPLLSEVWSACENQGYPRITKY